MKKTVYYSEFGAKGDGVTEDFAALLKCHEYANANGCTVKADAGATYYICETDGVTIPVMTDVDWGDATFIMDDTKIPVPSKSRTANIFTMKSSYQKKVYGEDSEIVKAINAKGGIKADEATNIGYAPGYPAILILFDYEHFAYIRWGCHAAGYTNNPQRELIVVDKDGNIDPNTKLLLDYKHVSSIEEYRIDDEPITVENGIFITKANAAPPVYTAYNRGLGINRSNVTIKNTVHKIVDEGETGAPYGGFIISFAANNVLCEGLTLQSHKSYKDYNPDGTVHSIMGSYDIGGAFTTNITFKNCVQSNFFKDEENKIAFSEREYWGIMGTNYCKNMTYDGCVLSRLDAHAGVYNVTVKDTSISYIKLIGGGVANIENCKVYQPDGSKWYPFFELRCDYGSTWRGDVIIKDCEFYKIEGAEATVIASASWNNWNFGYTTYLPNIVLDNFKVSTPGDVYIYSQMVSDTSLTIDMPTVNGEKNLNPYVITPTVTIKNDTQNNNYIGCWNKYVDSKITIVKE